MQTQATSAGERLSIRSLLQQSWRSVRREGIAVVALAFFANVVLIVIARPLIGLLFRRALQLSGEHGLDFTQLHLSAGSILALVLVLVIGLVAFALVAIQLILLLLALQQVASAGRVRLRMLFIALKQVSRRLFRVSSIPLFVYLFALLPISVLDFSRR